MFNSIKDSKIIVCLLDDIAIRWVHYLDPSKLLHIENNDYMVYQSKDCYFLYYKKDYVSLINLIKVNHTNYYHWLLTDFANVDKALKELDNLHISDFNYSIVNAMGETTFEDHPRRLLDLNNIKYYFSCCDILKKTHNNRNEISEIQNGDNVIINHLYSLIYFYVKCGFNFFEKGRLNFDIGKRKPGVFLYNKNEDRGWRNYYSSNLINNNKTTIKSFSGEDSFWMEMNNNLLHTPFIVDYNSHWFNFVFETQPPFDISNTHARFITEKTLKVLMVETPSYILPQKETYNSLIAAGFYFLNEEFGEYNLENYEKFVIFLKTCNHVDLEVLFTKAFEKSKDNKIKLEDYIYSYKEYEIKLLTNG